MINVEEEAKKRKQLLKERKEKLAQLVQKRKAAALKKKEVSQSMVQKTVAESSKVAAKKKLVLPSSLSEEDQVPQSPNTLNDIPIIGEGRTKNKLDRLGSSKGIHSEDAQAMTDSKGDENPLEFSPVSAFREITPALQEETKSIAEGEERSIEE